MIKKNLWLFFLLCIACEDQSLMKHPLDKSQSKTIVLDNELKVYLLSDPDFNISAASLAVDVGSLENPDNRLGLAHFLEHMLFLGTEKFPDVDEYSSYLKNNGGFSNAYTTTDHTNYQFQVLPDALEGAIDRFAQFFIGPLFTEEYTAREVNAVNSEHQKNIMNDGRRSYRFSQLFAKEGHPEQKFSTGDIETLGDINRTELLDFYDKHYSSNKMGLAILSTHSLDQLELWARKYFSDIKNRKLEISRHDPESMDKKDTFRLVKIEPVKDIRELKLWFSIPGTRHLYASKPGQQLGFILGHEGEGSLLSYLKDKGWAITLSAGASEFSRDYGAAVVTVGLTDKGLEEYKEVLKATIDYIDLMKKSGHQKHVFSELKSMASLNEIYSSKGEGMYRAIGLANEALWFPTEDVGRISYIYTNDSSEPYEELVQSLNVNTMLTMLIAKGVETDLIEHFYNAPYSYHEDENFYKELLKTKTREEFRIPKPNPFIPKKASVPKRELKDGVVPTQIEGNKGESLYFGQDHEFLRPKGAISLKILFPKDIMSPEHRAFSRIYAACVNESLNELSYPAKLAGLNYSIKEGYEGIYVDVSGYKESSLRLYELMLEHMTDFKITQSQFEAIKDKIVRDYENLALSDAYMQTRELAPDLFYNIKYTWKQVLPIAKRATFDEIKSYESNLFNKTYLEAMVYGDYVEQDAKKVLSVFKSKTKTEGISKEDAFELNYLNMSKPETVQYVDKLLVNNSCFFRMYEIGKDSPKTRALAALISKAVEQPFYTEMRTNQQLGYIVGSYPMNYDETYYLNFLIQSGDYPADDLNSRANTFISSTPKIVEELTDETFQQLIDSAIERLERKPMSISERAMKNKNLIFEHNKDFERDNKTIEALKKVKKEEVAVHLEKIISEKNRKMANILAFAENHANKSNVKSSFADLEGWKSTKTYD